MRERAREGWGRGGVTEKGEGGGEWVVRVIVSEGKEGE